MLAATALLPLGALLQGPGLAPAGRAVASCGRARAVVAEDAGEIEEPKIETACDFDYVPLLTALKAQDFFEADQLTRDGLITLAGPAAVKRGYVYFTDVPKLPADDLATIERLWNAYSGGKFGYTLQRAIYNSKKVSKNLEVFYDRIGWKNEAGSLLRWLPTLKEGNEFIYDVEKAPKGHLPLTSALRGTQVRAPPPPPAAARRRRGTPPCHAARRRPSARQPAGSDPSPRASAVDQGPAGARGVGARGVRRRVAVRRLWAPRLHASLRTLHTELCAWT